ncbi:MAG: radical SAM protein [Bacteroidales bacterium]|jgi:radical SAM protein with 4Fe4S-binding SPASM domain|nr:radical SAM protein [Bacteroidales bacterium]
MTLKKTVDPCVETEPFSEYGEWNLLRFGDASVFSDSSKFYPLDFSLFCNKNLEILEDKIESINLVSHIYPSNVCNQNCYYCFTRNDRILYPKRMLSEKAIDNIANSVERCGLKLARIVGTGEPLTNPLTPTLIKKLNQKGVYITLITNGELLDEDHYFGLNLIDLIQENVKFLRISIDASDSNTYQLLHNPSRNDAFKKILKSIENISKKKENNDIVIGATFIITTENMDQMVKFAKLCANIGVDVIWYRVVNGKNLSQYEIEIINKQIKDLKKVDIKINFEKLNKRIANLTYNMGQTCYATKFKSVVTSDGKVYPCITYQFNKKYELGNLNTNSLYEILSSDIYKNFLKARRSGLLKCCEKGCHEKVFNNSMILHKQNISSNIFYKEYKSYELK